MLHVGDVIRCKRFEHGRFDGTVVRCDPCMDGNANDESRAEADFRITLIEDHTNETWESNGACPAYRERCGFVVYADRLDPLTWIPTHEKIRFVHKWPSHRASINDIEVVERANQETP